jgi:hypothetical protein
MGSYGRVILCALGASIFTIAVAQGCGGTGNAPSGGSGSAGTSAGGGSSDSSGTIAGGTGGAGGTSGAGSPTGSSSSGFSTGAGADCIPGGTQCTDCVDNDGDNQFDAWDTECVGPLDNDEGSFATGIPGDNSDPCKQDCFFDGNSGSGNDGCLWDLSCDPLNPGAPDCSYDPSQTNCPGPPSDKCLDFCGGLTPNGCDCFGCCEITLANMTKVTILLGAGCSEEQAQNPEVCKACTQRTECLNTCETCEFCLGKPELPPECTPGSSSSGSGSGSSSGSGGGNGCDPTEQACDPNTPCPLNYYCLTGCCIKPPA